MFGEIERGKSLEMADDGFSHVAGVEQEFIDQRHGQGFHVLAHFGQQHQTPFEQGGGALFAEIALVAKELAGEVSGELFHRGAIMNVAGGELERHDFMEVIEHQMQLPSRPGEFHPQSLTDPDVRLSPHPARASAGRSQRSVRDRAPFLADWLALTAMTSPLRSIGITLSHCYYGTVRPRVVLRYFR